MCRNGRNDRRNMEPVTPFICNRRMAIVRHNFTHKNSLSSGEKSLIRLNYCAFQNPGSAIATESHRGKLSVFSQCSCFPVWQCIEVRFLHGRPCCVTRIQRYREKPAIRFAEDGSPLNLPSGRLRRVPEWPAFAELSALRMSGTRIGGKIMEDGNCRVRHRSEVFCNEGGN